MKIYKYADDYNHLSSDFKVYAAGKEIKVYKCTVSAYPFNRVWQGTQRSKAQTEETSYVLLGSNGAVTLEIEAKEAFENVIVRPLANGIKADIKNNTAVVTFNQCGQYSVEFDGMHKAIALFINPEKSFEKAENLIYFGAGVHILDERLELQDNQTVLIDEGAVLYGSINATGKRNIKVLGYGILDNSRMRRANEINGCAVLAKEKCERSGNPIYFNKCQNVEIDGITIIDSSGWNVYLDGCEDVTIDNIKVIGQWRYNSDGCDFCNCKNSVLKNSFLRTFDDCVVVKGFKQNNDLPVQNILVDNCVLWCDWGRALEVGAETSAPYMKDIIFKNCSIIHGSAVMLDIQHGDRADIENVIFEKINMEYSGEERKEAIQETEDAEYKYFERFELPVPFNVTSGTTMWSIDRVSGNLQNVYFKDISILSPDNVIPVGGEINANSGFIKGVHFENIEVNGEKHHFSEFRLRIGAGVSDIYYDK